MRRFLIILAAVCVLPGCVGAAFTGADLIYHRHQYKKMASDYSITLEANSALSDKAFDDSNISVTTYHHLVLLTGQTLTPALQKHAAELIQKIPKVLKVYNAITVDEPVSFSTETSDTLLTTKVKMRLIANDDIDPSEVKVITENGVVYLMGILPPDQQKIAAHIASHTPDVKKVIEIFIGVNYGPLNN